MIKNNAATNFHLIIHQLHTNDSNPTWYTCPCMRTCKFVQLQCTVHAALSVLTEFRNKRSDVIVFFTPINCRCRRTPNSLHRCHVKHTSNQATVTHFRNVRSSVLKNIVVSNAYPGYFSIKFNRSFNVSWSNYFNQTVEIMTSNDRYSLS